MTKCDKCKKDVDKTQTVKGWELCIECWEAAGHSLAPEPHQPYQPFVFPNTPSLPYYAPIKEPHRWEIGDFPPFYTTTSGGLS